MDHRPITTRRTSYLLFLSIVTNPLALRIHLASLDSRRSVDTVLGGALGNGLGLVAGGGALELLADGLDAASTGAGDSGGSTEVGVDAGKDLSVVGLDVLNHDAARN
jgi:hypothetical protein